MSAITSWHRGEAAVRQKLGYDKIPQLRRAFDMISGEMPEQHSTFYTTRLHFLPITTLDQEGRPWGSIASGKGGEPGFVRHPKYNTLVFDIESWNGDPLLENIRGDGPHLIAGIGVEVATRRRNKFAGTIHKNSRNENSISLEVEVTQAIGNCPKYITVRDVYPITDNTPTVLHSENHLSEDQVLADEAIELIMNSDTTFLGTTYAAAEKESDWNPSHVGMNHRGGRPGFIRVRKDKRTVVLPDFSGNRIMTSLGNVEATPYASLTFVSFTTGDILYVTGTAKNYFGDDARAIMPLQDSLTEIYVTGYTYVRDALPVREKPNIQAQPSPYSPPVKYLAEENAPSKIFTSSDQPTALLSSIDLHNDDIATFRWELSSALAIKPGQAIILDLSPLLGSRHYQHMAPLKPSSVNDDFIRTWTVSSFSGDEMSNEVAVTMRHKPGGTVTSALFTIAKKMNVVRPELMGDARKMDLRVKVAGVSGNFTLPVVEGGQEDVPRHLFWIAGGIGITPFLAMLEALRTNRAEGTFAITFVLSTREPEVLLPLVEKVALSIPSLQLLLHVFTTRPLPETQLNITHHHGRVSRNDLSSILQPTLHTSIYLCGPDPFQSSITTSLQEIGIPPTSIISEGFTY
ncbi:hypothetical protein CVT24_004602 [Panaeolus cyanescens]|uniref:Oxidoreductase FAD/NAD(P)-binding domain-containing protein n=1 Tax=Panaeolus cyanescens TaxID=181874 RepID=A0A409YBC1_9AGAR|nr:hypothetical protein CVT24_004602 [Panaeolus cyanescens]